jgi:hypothetical protein
MAKKELYQDLIETFENGGGREPYWEEALAWNIGYNAGFDAAVKQMEDGLELDPEAKFSPDNEILAKAFEELDAQKARVSEES